MAKKKSYKNEWLGACFGAAHSGGLINVKFRGRDVANFTRGMFNILITDPELEWITDDETGEILFSRN